MRNADKTEARPSLEESSERYRKIFCHSNDAIFILDPQRDAVLEANPRACEMLGYSLEELLAIRVSDIHPYEMPQVHAFAQSVMEDGVGWTNELTCRSKDGDLINAEISASALEVAGRPVMMALVRDISDRKRAEGALRETEERYRKVFYYSSDAIFITDPANDRILDANPRACSMLGYTLDELLDIPVSAIHRHEMPKMMAFAQLVTENGEGWTDELSCMTKGGQTMPCEISASTMDIGGTNCTISTVRDLTERRQAEETRREMAVMEERTRLAREIHDSIAQGLTGIIWQLNVLEKALPSGGEEVLTSLLRVRNLAKDSLQEARRSVWDLRTGPLGGRSLKKVLLHETEKIETDGEVSTSVIVTGRERVLPSGVETALLRISQESLTNILKYAGATEVNLTLAFEDSRVRLTVQDNGVGFDPEAPRAAGKETGGFGLINMRERARLLGGELTVQSEPGQGTRVEAVLPLS